MAYNAVPAPNAALQSRGYGASPTLSAPSTGVGDFASTPAHPIDSSPLSQSLHQNAFPSGDIYSDLDDVANKRGSTVMDLERAGLQRTASTASSSAGIGSGGAVGGGLSRGNTLQKKASIKRKSSLKRSGSRRSIHAGSLKGVSMDGEAAADKSTNSVFYTPIPTSGSPTDILANRFQAWRKFLKDLITYFREIQASYDNRSKALLKVSNVVNNTNAPPIFMTSGGINDANTILRDFHKHTLTEANKARDIENDVIAQLNGLRADLAAKIKEIKSLSGDFKNSVEKEKDQTRKAVAHLEEALAAVDGDPTSTTGRDDPFIIRLAVDRQIEKQIDEENYLHNAYLNLERSGRELESIVVGEIQKAYNALASILKREADENYDAVERLRSGPITMPRDSEWARFVESDPHFVSPDVPVRHVEEIEYPGKHHPAAVEVRAGMLERKSKYLKSYTPGWYVLSPTHLHEFKSADRIYSQPPVMSLFLPDQKLGAHSQPGSSSHKFMLKGRQTGSMHRGHSWVFRAETYDTMLAWYDDIRALTNTTGKERDAFVRKHVRSMSAGSYGAASVSGDSMEEDEADEVPYSANTSSLGAVANAGLDGQQDGAGKEAVLEQRPGRPQPGGRFPSDLNMGANRDLRGGLVSPSSGNSTSEENNHEFEHVVAGRPDGQAAAAAGDVLVAQGMDGTYYGEGNQRELPHQQRVTPARTEPYGGYPMMHHASSVTGGRPHQQPEDSDPIEQTVQSTGGADQFDRQSANYAEWMAPARGGAAGVAASTAATEEYWRHKKMEAEQSQAKQPPQQGDGDASLPAPPPRAEGHAIPEAILVPPLPALDGHRDSGDVTSPALSGVASTEPTTLSEASTTADGEDDDATVGGKPLAKTESFGTAYDTGKNGNPNAKVTGNIFPSVMRHNTDVSVGELHIPGEFPPAH